MLRDGLRGRALYRSISAGPGQGPGLVNGLADRIMSRDRPDSLTFAGTGHGCEWAQVVDSEVHQLQLDAIVVERGSSGHMIG